MPKSFLSQFKSILCAGIAVSAFPAITQAQQLAPEWEPMEAADSAPVSEANAGGKSRGGGSDRPKVEVTPYIEATQVVLGELTGGGEVLTYSTVAVGLDTSVQTRRAEAQVNVRYERVIGYDSNVDDQDTVTGIARGSAAIARGLSIDVGGVATRSRIDGRGAAANSFFPTTDNVTQVYSVYTGPSYTTQIGELGLNASYRAGYTKVEFEGSRQPASGAATARQL